MMGGMEWIVTFELPHGGPGPDSVTSEELAAEFDAIVVVLLRDHYCQVSREHAAAYSEQFEAFTEAGAAILAALPDSQDRATYWRRRYDLNVPVLADSAAQPATTDAETAAAPAAMTDAETAAAPAAMTDGTNRFDAFADIEAGIDTLPGVGILDAQSTYPRLVHSQSGSTIQECPDPEDVLDVVQNVVG
jgi:peroxiredoxin